MTEAKTEMRPQVLLSVQRALLGEVFPSLRGVALGWDDRRIGIVCYIDGPISTSDQDRLASVETEVQADFSEAYEIELEIVRCDAPAKMAPLQAWAYLRRET
jgi:hypothetical protein